jgi:hypothetical protein
MDVKLIRHRFSNLESLCEKLQTAVAKDSPKFELQQIVAQLKRELQTSEINLNDLLNLETISSLGITAHEAYLLHFHDVDQILKKPNLSDKKMLVSLTETIQHKISLWEQRVLSYMDDARSKNERISNLAASARPDQNPKAHNKKATRRRVKMNKYQDLITQSKIVLLLGAGASQPLGIPTMKEFWSKIKSAAENKMRVWDARDALRKIEEVHSINNIDKSPDLEHLLLLLDKYSQYYNIMFHDPIFGFKFKEAFKYDGLIYTEAGAEIRTKKYLEDYVRYAWWYSAGVARLYDALYQLMVELYWQELEPNSVLSLYNPLVNLFSSEMQLPLIPIFTTNYDNAIEKYCEYTQTDLEYGFITLGARNKWNSYSFAQYIPPRDKFGIVLFKLHGSLSWHREHREIINYARPTGYAPGSSAVIYPTQTKEYPYEEPFKTAYRYFENCLRNAKVMIVIGYSFRDPGLISIIRDAEEANKDLTFIVLCGRNILESESFRESCPRNIIPIPAYFRPGEDAEYLPPLREQLKSLVS